MSLKHKSKDTKEIAKTSYMNYMKYAYSKMKRIGV